MPSSELPQPSPSVGALASCPGDAFDHQRPDGRSSAKASQASELEEYRAIFEFAPVGMCCVDLNGRFVRVNPFFCTMLGYSQDELFGMTFMEVTHPDDHDDGVNALQAMLAGELDAYVKEKRYVNKSGAVVWANITTAMRRAASGEPLFTVGVIQPIGRRRQAEKALHESEQRFRTLFEQAPLSVQLLGKDGRTLMVNQAWIDLWQTTRETVDSFILTDYQIFNDPQVIAIGLVPYLQRAYAGESVITPPVYYDPAQTGRAGRPRWAMGFVHPIKDDGGQVREVMLIHHDVSEQIEVQAQLQQAKEAAESASRAKSAFLANMSHELRTPLGAILGFSELMREPQLGGDERAAYLDIVARNGAVLTRIIDDVLDLSRVEAGILKISRQPFDVQETIAEVMRLFAGEAATKKLCMRWSAHAQAPRFIDSDPVRLKQILINLIGNAVKFTLHGEISVELEAVDDRTGRFAISITDTGIGIPALHHGKLFRPFSQVDYDDSRQFGGTGLGLVLSQRLAQALGGEVYLAASTPERGSRFVVSLLFVEAASVSDPGQEPLRHGGQEDHDARGRQGARDAPALASCPAEVVEPQRLSVMPAPAKGGLRLAGRRILVVDDAADNRLLLLRLFEKHGASVELAHHGQEALTKASLAPYDVIIMDMQMPVLDGFKATRALRRQGFKKAIIALTAHAMKAQLQRCLDVGCDAYLSKPFVFEHLVSTVVGYCVVTQSCKL